MLSKFCQILSHLEIPISSYMLDTLFDTLVAPRHPSLTRGIYKSFLSSGAASWLAHLPAQTSLLHMDLPSAQLHFSRHASHLLWSWPRQDRLLSHRSGTTLCGGPAGRVACKGYHALLLRRAKLGPASGCGHVAGRLPAALLDGADEPWRLPAAFPAPVLLELIFARL